jgi:hypothetical protein
MPGDVSTPEPAKPSTRQGLLTKEFAGHPRRRQLQDEALWQKYGKRLMGHGQKAEEFPSCTN